MSDIILKDDGSPFATIASAQARKTRMGVEGLDVNVVEVDGGYALERNPYKKPKKRIPISTRSVLKVPSEDKDPNYHYRFVNDEENRIRMFRDAGWEVVQKREGMQTSDETVGVSSQLGSVVTKSVGQNKIGYLMRIKKEYYEEDQESKAENIRQQEKGLYTEQRKKGRYGGVKIGNKPQY